jgi:hypothetical protein
VNPEVDKLPKEKFSQTETLGLNHLKSKMSDQGTNTGTICYYEHFVRAGEIMIAEKLGDTEGAKRLHSNMSRIESLSIYRPY